MTKIDLIFGLIFSALGIFAYFYAGYIKKRQQRWDAEDEINIQKEIDKLLKP